jgi:hypothetical protein
MGAGRGQGLNVYIVLSSIVHTTNENVASCEIVGLCFLLQVFEHKTLCPGLSIGMLCTLRSLGIAITSRVTAMKAMENARVVGVENWLGNFYPSGKILLFFLIRIG